MEAAGRMVRRKRRARPPGFVWILTFLLTSGRAGTSASAQKGDGCGHTVLGPESGTLASINYPQTYPNNTVCEWEIWVKPGRRIHLKFGDFDIEDSDSCHFNYLRVYNGIGPSRTEIGKYCGLGLQWEKLIESKSNEVTVQFMSGTHISGRGFLASYSTTEESDLITCLDKGSHFSDPEFSKFCPAGCLTTFGEVSGTIPHGYRDSSLLCMAGIHAGVVSNFLGGRIDVVLSKGIPYYEHSLANNVTSKVGPLSASLFTFKTSGCYGTLGMESGVIRNSQITASSVLQWHDLSGQLNTWSPEKARLKKPGPPWAAYITDETQWLQVDLKKEKKVTGIITSGSTMVEYYFYVSTYRVLYSNDGLKWMAYKEVSADQDKVFQGNINSHEEVRNNFIPPITARYIRINPQQWYQKIAMKVEFLGCQPSLVRAPSLPMPPRISTDFPLQPNKTEFTPVIKNTTVTPNLTKDVALAAVLVPVLVMVFTALILILVCAWHWRNRKKKTEGTYDLPYWDRTGWWKGMKQFLPAKSTDHEDTPVRYSSSSEVSRLRSRDVATMLQAESAEYAQPLVGGVVGTLRQRSTFKPEDGNEGGYADNDPYDSPVQEIYHAYAEPLPATGPEYATPIIMDISSHPTGTLGSSATSTFKSPGSTVPVLLGSHSKLVSRTDSASSGQVLYDTPKGMPGPSSAEELVYQVPQSAHTTADKDGPLEKL
ncbi:discoidin, CUB and LCCL domain-containing protein 2 [Latimeria chalumnae]|uniref:discoidin, CUB and LCCL domain-containing protein 2 n=1 Tax=Latimeria chalumnae TaxID=7897 RepID=UPI0003C12B62|nr:PREDICTED: discoidin, CUB and LCCL domain-containing protein 2 [Latimeria chalumnae]|eukprot:XP_006009003.1 PREDICTED: discoidin, CUB and LCCL domain-containing protein 2 [Latimeria chalumnae]